MTLAVNPFNTRRDGTDFEVVDTRTGRIVAVCLPGRDAAEAEAARLWHAELLAAPEADRPCPTCGSDGSFCPDCNPEIDYTTVCADCGGEYDARVGVFAHGDDGAVTVICPTCAATQDRQPEVIISEPVETSSPYGARVPGARYYAVTVIVNGGAPKAYILENESQVIELSPHADPAAVAQFRAARGRWAMVG